MTEKNVMENSMNPRPKTRKKIHWKSVLLGLAILCCGMVIGVGITLHVGHSMILHTLNPGDRMASHITRKIDRKLDLTDEQKAEVEKIVTHRVSEFRNILDTMYPDIKKQITSMHQEVAGILTEKQRVKWEKHTRKIQRKLEQHKPKGTGPDKPDQPSGIE